MSGQLLNAIMEGFRCLDGPYSAIIYFTIACSIRHLARFSGCSRSPCLEGAVLVQACENRIRGRFASHCASVQLLFIQTLSTAGRNFILYSSIFQWVRPLQKSGSSSC